MRHIINLRERVIEERIRCETRFMRINLALSLEDQPLKLFIEENSGEIY